MENFKLESKKKYTGANKKNATNKQLQVGCLQRIADSLEKIENPYKELLSTVKYYRKRHHEQMQTIKDLRYSNRALKGVITRIKNKA